MKSTTIAYKNISASDVKKIMNEADVQVVDVREPYEYASGHIEVAVNIPLQTIPSAMDSFDKNKRLVLVCASGGRSANASQYMMQQGFEVYNMIGGMMSWR